MNSLLRHIKSLFVPDTIQHPFAVKAQPVTPVEVLPDNLKYIKGQAFVQQDFRDGFEADIWTGQTGQRSDQMTPADQDIIKTRRLKESKYRELKVMWAAHYSAAQAARELRSRKGHGQRTLEKYWSAMNAASEASPLSLE